MSPRMKLRYSTMRITRNSNSTPATSSSSLSQAARSRRHPVSVHSLAPWLDINGALVARRHHAEHPNNARMNGNGKLEYEEDAGSDDDWSKPPSVKYSRIGGVVYVRVPRMGKGRRPAVGGATVFSILGV